MKKLLTESLKYSAKKLLFPTPSHLKNKQIKIDDVGFSIVRKSIQDNFYKNWANKSNHEKEAYEDDLNAHLHRRLDNDRCLIIPWLDRATTLEGKHILEIGCGTGSSAVSLAEQGALVTGIDVNEKALLVARDRVKAYGLEAEFSTLNADKIGNAFIDQSFDIIIFFASLEHMTITERLTSLRDAWNKLGDKGLLVIVETPNRLWHFDQHTSMLPFYHWLPNDLAFEYSKFSPRENFNDRYKEYTEKSKEQFLRRGRGMSFHELDLAIKPAQELKIISSFSSYAKFRYRLKLSAQERKYRSILRNMRPDLHQGFFDDTLYMIIEKD